MKITRRQLQELILESSDDTGRDDEPLLGHLVDMAWLPYGLDSSMVYMDVEDVERLSELPALGFSPSEALSRFRNRFNLKTLDTYVFGDIGQHRYSNTGPMGFERHPTGKLMFPPAWTLAAHALILKSKVLREKFEQALIDEDRQSLIDIAIENGFGRGRGDRELEGAARMMDVLDRAATLEDLDDRQGGLT